MACRIRRQGNKVKGWNRSGVKLLCRLLFFKNYLSQNQCFFSKLSEFIPKLNLGFLNLEYKRSIEFLIVEYSSEIFIDLKINLVR